jgi:hypothetical protein
MAKFVGTGASQLARVDEKNERRTAVLGASTARLGAAPIAGGERRPAS